MIAASPGPLETAKRNALMPTLIGAYRRYGRPGQSKHTYITEDKILTDYEETLALAKKQEKSDSMVNAATAQAKLVGLLKGRIETKNVDDFGSMDSISACSRFGGLNFCRPSLS